MELQGQDAVHPEWDMYKSQFYTGMLMNALRADSLASTHPIEATIGPHVQKGCLSYSPRLCR